VTHGACCGLKEAALLAVPTSLGLAALGWAWSAGLWCGLLAVVVGRVARALLSRHLTGGPRAALRAALGGVAAQGIMATLAVGASAYGLPPLAVAGGLSLGVAGMWWHVWKRLVRQEGRWTSWARS